MSTAVTSVKSQFPDALVDEQMPYWVEIRLVDEKGTAVANIPWVAESHFPGSGKVAQYQGQSKADGLIRIDMEHGLELTLFLEPQPLADEMEKRPLRVKRGTDASLIRQDIEQKGEIWHYAVIGELCRDYPQIEKRDGEAFPPLFHFPPDKALKGYVIRTNQLEKRHVIEICPFRTWELVLHHQDEYSIANAINLGEVADLAYDEPDSVTDFFISQCQDLSTLPSRTLNGFTINALVCDVPFSERYFPPVCLDSAKAEEPEGDTQFFYVYNKDKIIVSWRGTASLSDGITDGSFRPIVAESCDTKTQCSTLFTKGKVHTGFWTAYSMVEKKFQSKFQKLQDLLINLNLFICGHSLGGSLALIHSAKLKNYNPILYTYGMPRTFTRDAVEQLSAVTHFRHVNDKDPVPSVHPIKIPLQQQGGSDIWRAKVAMTGGGFCDWRLSEFTLGIEYTDATHLGKDLVPGTAVGATIVVDDNTSRSGQLTASPGDLDISEKYYPYIRERHISEESKSLSLLGKEDFITYKTHNLKNVSYKPVIDERKIIRFIEPHKKTDGVYSNIIYPDGSVAPERTLFPDFDKVDKMEVK